MSKSNKIPFQFLIDPEIQAALMELCRKKLILQRIRAQKEQEEMAREFGEAKAINGIGAHTMQIHADAYHDIAEDMGGYEIWQQKDFVRHFLKRAPECKVKCGGTKIQVGFTGEKRFSKSYPSPNVQTTA